MGHGAPRGSGAIDVLQEWDRMSLSKDIRKLVQEAERQGWRIEDRGKLWLCKSPNGTMIVTVHKTPSDRRAIHNTLSLLRKGGFDPDA